jgi:peptide/nickel transport system substrate-binding protein
MGQNAFWDYSRYSNPAVAPLLDKAGAATSAADKKAAYAELDKIYMQDIPGIPLMYRPLLFYEFNTSVWTNFPTADNPMGTSPQWYIDVLRDVKLK